MTIRTAMAALLLLTAPVLAGEPDVETRPATEEQKVWAQTLAEALGEKPGPVVGVVHSDPTCNLPPGTVLTTSRNQVVFKEHRLTYAVFREAEQAEAFLTLRGAVKGEVVLRRYMLGKRAEVIVLTGPRAAELRTRGTASWDDDERQPILFLFRIPYSLFRILPLHVVPYLRGCPASGVTLT